jgi:hypothetical protein
MLCELLVFLDKIIVRYIESTILDKFLINNNQQKLVQRKTFYDFQFKYILECLKDFELTIEEDKKEMISHNYAKNNLFYVFSHNYDWRINI